MSLSKPWSTLKRLSASSGALFLLGLSLSSLPATKADNPIVQTIYTADPAPMVYDGRVYMFTTHDEDGADYFDMKDWHVYSTNDMANWQDHGAVLSLDDFDWADLNAWAPQAVERNGKFYLYVPMRLNGAQMGIGVGVSDSITGPYSDARGSPLVADGEIDPTVFIDDDNQAYLFWGNPNLWYAKLNEDMISFASEPQKIELTVEGFGPREGEQSAERPTAYEEGPWLYKRGDTYYMIYAANCCSEDIRYSTAPSVTGPWTYGGIVMETEGGSFTNHPAVVEYEGNAYFFYHNGALPGGGGFQRSVAAEDFTYNSDGSIPAITMSSAGLAQIRSLDPYTRQEAETGAWFSGVETEPSSAGGMFVGDISPGDYIKVNGVDFGAGASSFTASVASGGSGGTIEIRLGGTDGQQVGVCDVASTGDYQTWETVECEVSGAEGTSDLYFVFQGSGDGLFNFDWWQFE